METILSTLSGWLWGLPLLVVVIGTGIFFTVGSGFFQFRRFGLIMKSTFGNLKKKADPDDTKKGILTPFQAVSIALAGSIGVGNIAGVSSAVALGGPGAVFWMWCAAILGMIIKMVEVTLAVHYRDELSDGSTYGGPTYYMEKGLGKEKGMGGLWKIPAVIFSFGIFCSMVITLQSYSVAEAVESTFSVPMLVTGSIYMILMYIAIFGGIKRIGYIASILVPLMSGFFILGVLILMIKYAHNIIPSLKLIVKSAFTPMAAVGGFGGTSISLALRQGFARSVYSNEAGWGTAPMAHATAKTEGPIQQGMWGAFEVFVDTILVCTATALAILITGQWSSGASGATLTLDAFQMGMGTFGRYVVTIFLFLFGWTTSTGWWTYAETMLRQLLRGKEGTQESILKVIKFLYPIPPFLMIVLAVSTGLPPKIIWLFGDVITAIPTFVNLLAMLALSGTFFKLLRNYEAGLESVIKDNDIAQ